jgi:hypothetical protein
VGAWEPGGAPATAYCWEDNLQVNHPDTNGFPVYRSEDWRRYVQGVGCQPSGPVDITVGGVADGLYPRFLALDADKNVIVWGWRSQDDGFTYQWYRWSADAPGWHPLGAGPGDVMVLSRDGVDAYGQDNDRNPLCTTDGGATWQRCAAFPRPWGDVSFVDQFG